MAPAEFIVYFVSKNPVIGKLSSLNNRARAKNAAAFLAVCWLAIAAPAAHARRLPETIFKIAVLENVSSFNLESGSAMSATDLASGRTETLSAKNVIPVKASDEGILVGNIAMQGPVRITPKGDVSTLRANGKNYRDSFLILRSSYKKITLVNELGLEGYIYGILPKEVSADWPLESLKAQAVVSRTYALKNRLRHKSEGFDLCSTVHCQVYGGVDGEKERTNRAVDDTRYEVLTYDGELAGTFFFSNCGGSTESPIDVWETSFAPKYLKPVRCRTCSNDRHYEWEQEVSGRAIQKALEEKGFRIDLPISALQISGRTRSERAKFFRVKHGGGSELIRGNAFRMMLGPQVLRSTMISRIKKAGDGFLIEGKGWGHGVGLCQEGARGMAEKKESYRNILKFYYPGTRLEKWED